MLTNPIFFWRPGRTTSQLSLHLIWDHVNELQPVKYRQKWLWSCVWIVLVFVHHSGDLLSDSTFYTSLGFSAALGAASSGDGLMMVFWWGQDLMTWSLWASGWAISWSHMYTWIYLPWGSKGDEGGDKGGPGYCELDDMSFYVTNVKPCQLCYPLKPESFPRSELCGLQSLGQHAYL